MAYSISNSDVTALLSDKTGAIFTSTELNSKGIVPFAKAKVLKILSANSKDYDTDLNATTEQPIVDAIGIMYAAIQAIRRAPTTKWKIGVSADEGIRSVDKKGVIDDLKAEILECWDLLGIEETVSPSVSTSGEEQYSNTGYASKNIDLQEGEINMFGA